MLCPVLFLKSGTGAIFGSGVDLAPRLTGPTQAFPVHMRLLNRLHPLPSPFSESGWGDSPQLAVSGGAIRSTPPASTGANRSTLGPVFPDSCAPFPIGAFWSIGTELAYVLGHEPSREVGRHWGHEGHWGRPCAGRCSIPVCTVFRSLSTHCRSRLRSLSHEEVFEFVRPSVPLRHFH